MSIVDSDMYLGTGGGWWDQVGLGMRTPPPPPPNRITYETSQVLESCSKGGIDRACVTPLVNDTYEAANRHVAEACAKHPDKLIGIAAHSPQREAGRIRELLTTEVRSMGMKAVRSDGHPTRELLDTVRDLNIPIFFYPVLQYLESPPSGFYLMADLYPDVNFVLPHMGKYGANSNFANYRATVDYLRGQPNVYLGTSAMMYIKMIALGARVLPPEKLLFGSCAPHLDTRVAVESIRLLHLPREQQVKVMGDNLLNLLRI